MSVQDHCGEMSSQWSNLTSSSGIIFSRQVEIFVENGCYTHGKRLQHARPQVTISHVYGNPTCPGSIHTGECREKWTRQSWLREMGFFFCGGFSFGCTAWYSWMQLRKMVVAGCLQNFGVGGWVTLVHLVLLEGIGGVLWQENLKVTQNTPQAKCVEWGARHLGVDLQQLPVSTLLDLTCKLHKFFCSSFSSISEVTRKNSSLELTVIWGNFTCSDLACSDLPYSDLAHSDLACSDLARFFVKILTFFHLIFITWELI